jgi:hypothetical protein
MGQISATKFLKLCENNILGYCTVGQMNGEFNNITSSMYRVSGM